MQNSKESQKVVGNEGSAPKERSFFVNNLIKLAVFAVISLGVLVGTFFLEGALSSEKLEEEVQDRVVVRAEDGAFEIGDEEITFEPGHFWVNLAVAEDDLMIKVSDQVMLDPNKAVFEMVYEENNLEINVFDGDLKLLLLDGDHLLNELLVPRASRVRVPFRKIDDRLNELLTNKLRKELFYSALPASALESEFVVGNLEEDVRFVGALRQGYRTDVVASGLEDDFGVFNLMANSLTFVPNKREELKLTEVFSHINNAIYYAEENDKVKMKEELSLYELAYASLSFEYRQGEMYKDKLLSHLSDLSVFDFNDLEYEVYLFLLEKSGLAQDSELVDLYWNNVYKGLDVSAGEAHRAFDLYYNEFGKLVNEDTVNYQKYLEDQNQLFDNLFLRFPDFYRDGYFALKEDLEGKILTFYEGKDKEELTQAFLDSKIDFLKRLRRYFFDGEIDNAETKKIFRRLMNGARALLPKEESTVAVIALFETELNDIDDFWGYLSSPEYQTSFYGSDHEERYQAYLKERQEVFGFVEIRQDVFGETVEVEVSNEEVAAEVADVLEGKFDIAGVKLESLDDSKERYVHINAVVGGYPFRAIFDRDAELISEVYVYDELISDRAIKPSNLFALVADRFADLSDDQIIGDEELTVESVAQRRARLYVAQLVEDAGFDAEIEDIRVLSEEDAVYRVEGVTLNDYEDVAVTFDIAMNGEVATNLFMSVNGDPQVVAGEFELDEVFKLADAERVFLEVGSQYDPEVLLGRKVAVPKAKVGR